jgi:hypothetical protein
MAQTATSQTRAEARLQRHVEPQCSADLRIKKSFLIIGKKERPYKSPCHKKTKVVLPQKDNAT